MEGSRAGLFCGQRDGLFHVTAANFGQHTGGNAVWPGRQFQFALTYRFQVAATGADTCR